MTALVVESVADPCALEAEQHLLGSILADHDALADVRGSIAPEDFYEPKHAALYQRICSCSDRGIEVNDVSLAEMIGGEDGSYVLSLRASVIDGGHAEELGRVVSDFAARRRALNVARLAARLAGDTRDLDAMQKIQALAINLLDARRGAGPRRVSEFADEVMQAVEVAQTAEPDENGIRTGLHNLDKVIGGLRPGMVMVVAARPSEGKSSFATSVLLRVGVDRQVPCGLFTVEVPKNDALKNLACCHARVNGHDLDNGKLSDADYESFVHSFMAVRAAPIFMDDGDITSASIRASMRRLALAHGVKLAIVDYLQLLSPDVGGDRHANRQQEVSRMSRNIKLAAKEAGMPVIVLAQLNREVESRKGAPPRLSDLRESGSIEQDADIVVLLHPAPKRAEIPIAAGFEAKRLIVAKNRNGPRASNVVALLNKQCTRFESLATDQVWMYERYFETQAANARGRGP